MNKSTIDQLGNKIFLGDTLTSIVSVVPSQTELLYFLGMEDQVKGITDFCVHPADKTTKVQKVGGPKTLKTELIKNLNPDLIIAGKEENSRQQIEELQKDFPVWVSDVRSLEDAYKMIEKIGIICNKSELAQNLANNISQSLDNLHKKTNIRVAYLIWENPYMTAGQNTFIHDILTKLGFINAFGELSRYPKVSSKQLLECNADFILLPSEPYHFTSQHIDKFKKLSPRSKVILVNGQFFSWYGSRLLLAAHYFKSIQNIIYTLHKK